MAVLLEDQVTHSSKSASFDSDAIDTGATLFGSVTLDVTEDVNGTLDAEIEHSPDGTNWYSFPTALTFTQFTATGVQTKDLPDGKFHRYIRVAYTVGGGGTFTIAQSTTARG